MKTIDWLRANELPGGGIAAWPGKIAYPEVTGYLIPSLFDWGETALAVRCAEWLVKFQNPMGGFISIDGTPILYTFDTAAALQGLERAYQETGKGTFLVAANRARSFVMGHLLPDNQFEAWKGVGTRQYCKRVNGIMNIDLPFIIHADRVHFTAYALEGYLALGHRDDVRAELERMPMRGDGLAYFAMANGQGYGNDIIATAQVAILRMLTGLNADAQVAAVRRHVKENGGIPQSVENQTEMSWGAKFFLDMELLCTRV